MRKFLILGVAALAVTACSKNADSDGDGKVSGQEAAAQMKIEPGQWEIKVTTSEIDMPGAPPAVKAQVEQQMAKGVTISTCLKPEDVEKPGGNFFGADTNSNCTFDKFDRSGSKMSTEMTCKFSGMTIHTTSDGEFTSDSYKLNTTQKADTPMGTRTSKGTVEGRRTGDCKA